MPFRAESSSFRAYSARKPFPFHVCTMDADGSGNKRLTEKSEKKTKQHIDWFKYDLILYAVILSFEKAVF